VFTEKLCNTFSGGMCTRKQFIFMYMYDIKESMELTGLVGGYQGLPLPCHSLLALATAPADAERLLTQRGFPLAPHLCQHSLPNLHHNERIQSSVCRMRAAHGTKGMDVGIGSKIMRKMRSA